MARNKEIQALGDRVTKAAEDTLREIRSAARAPSGFEALEALAREYETATMVIKRRNEANNKMEIFSSQDGLLLNDIMSRNPELICKEEGGRGEYQVEIFAPPKEPGKQPQKAVLGPFNVGGPEQFPVAKSEMAKSGGVFPFAQMWGLPTANAANKDQSALTNTMATMMKQMSESNTNTFQGLMNMMFMERMMGGAQPAGGNGAMHGQGVSELKEEIRALRAERERDRDRQAQDERLRQIEERSRDSERRTQEMIDKLMTKLESNPSKDTSVELLKLQASLGKGNDDAWLKYLTLMREESRDHQQRENNLLMKLLERPDDAAQFSKITSSMMESSVQTLNVITQLAASGLVGGGGEKSWKDVAGDVLETVRTAFAARYGLAGMDEEGDQPLPIQAPPTQVLPQPQQALPEPQPQQQPEPAEDEEPEVEQLPADAQTLKSLLLTEEELDSMGRDRAASQVFKAIREGDYNQASARIFGLAYSDHSPYQRWMQIPGPLSGQVLTHFKMPEHMLAMTDNLNLFNEYLDEGGDPNEWSDQYTPIKPKPRPKQSQLVGPRPDFGLKQGELPSDIRPVDPSVPPPGIDPELVQKQREERQRRGVLEKMKQVRENVEKLQAGKLTKPQIAHLRENNQLPEDAEVEQFMAESEQIISQLEGAAQPPTPAPPTPPANTTSAPKKEQTDAHMAD